MTGLAAVILTGCQKQDIVTDAPVPENPDYVLADLSLSLPASSARTRLDHDVVQAEDGSFRGISKLSIIPFTKQGKIELTDKPAYSEASNYTDVTTQLSNPPVNAHWFFYNKFYLKRGVASILTYGQSDHVPAKPNNEIDDKVYYGSLRAVVDGTPSVSSGIPEGLQLTPANLSFELDPIYNTVDENNEIVAPARGNEIAAYLTQIAEAKNMADGTSTWKASNDAKLRRLYEGFINLDVNSGLTKDIAGSAASVKAYVNDLYLKIYNLIYVDEYFTGNQTNLGIAQNILTRIITPIYSSRSLSVTYNQTDPTNQKVLSLGSCDSYPGDENLPDGAAVLRWVEDAFVPQLKTTTTDNVSNIDSYAYPPELYYISNSLIKTSNDGIDYSSKSSWTDVLGLYDDGGIVNSSTKAVAIVDPMQYAVARLSATVMARTGTLPDADQQSVTVDAQTFPVTGIIIGGQHPLKFDFTPKNDGDDDNVERYVYDSYLKNDSGDPIYLTTSKSDAFETLVLQTIDNENVTVVLELRNNSNKDFKGKSGVVFRGTKFYLAGKLKLKTPDDTKDHTKRVFTRDYTTTAEMTVETLANAYNVMPDIQAERLEVSVQIDLRWMQATPGSFELTEEGDED